MIESKQSRMDNRLVMYSSLSSPISITSFGFCFKECQVYRETAQISINPISASYEMLYCTETIPRCDRPAWLYKHHDGVVSKHVLKIECITTTLACTRMEEIHAEDMSPLIFIVKIQHCRRCNKH